MQLVQTVFQLGQRVLQDGQSLVQTVQTLVQLVQTLLQDGQTPYKVGQGFCRRVQVWLNAELPSLRGCWVSPQVKSTWYILVPPSNAHI